MHAIGKQTAGSGTGTQASGTAEGRSGLAAQHDESAANESDAVKPYTVIVKRIRTDHTQIEALARSEEEAKETGEAMVVMEEKTNANPDRKWSWATTLYDAVGAKCNLER